MSAIKDALASAAEALHISGDKDKKAIGGGAPVYVDEKAGNDDAADGSKASPFATPLAALLAKGQDASVFVKKADAAPVRTASMPTATLPSRPRPPRR